MGTIWMQPSGWTRKRRMATCVAVRWLLPYSESHRLQTSGSCLHEGGMNCGKGWAEGWRPSRPSGPPSCHCVIINNVKRSMACHFRGVTHGHSFLFLLCTDSIDCKWEVKERGKENTCRLTYWKTALPKQVVEICYVANILFPCPFI